VATNAAFDLLDEDVGDQKHEDLQPATILNVVSLPDSASSSDSSVAPVVAHDSRHCMSASNSLSMVTAAFEAVATTATAPVTKRPRKSMNMLVDVELPAEVTPRFLSCLWRGVHALVTEDANAPARCTRRVLSWLIDNTLALSSKLPSAKDRFTEFHKAFEPVREEFRHLEAQLRTKFELWESKGYQPATYSKYEFLEGIDPRVHAHCLSEMSQPLGG
jgi:hypothetical protein